MTKIVGIIPARYGSSRFPGKPLADIGGKSMIQRVYEQALNARKLSEVIVATDDQRILEHVLSFGGKAVFTLDKHQSGTDRCAEVVSSLEGVDVAINIQGDEPFIEPEQIDQVASCFLDNETKIATLIKKIEVDEDLVNDSVVKVEIAPNGKAKNFSRKPFPFGIPFKHIGIYGYRAETLKTLSNLPQTKRELAERLEQLRWLDNGFYIQLAETEHESISVDTPQDLEALLKQKNL